jgi:hypothetical protein
MEEQDEVGYHNTQVDFIHPKRELQNGRTIQTLTHPQHFTPNRLTRIHTFTASQQRLPQLPELQQEGRKEGRRLDTSPS